MDDFLGPEDSLPNLNAWMGAGKVTKVESLADRKTPALAFTVEFMKEWPSGHKEPWPLKCYTTGSDKIDKLSWLKPGEVVLVSGELTNRGTVYVHQIQPWTRVTSDDSLEADRYPMPR